MKDPWFFVVEWEKTSGMRQSCLLAQDIAKNFPFLFFLNEKPGILNFNRNKIRKEYDEKAMQEEMVRQEECFGTAGKI